MLAINFKSNFPFSIQQNIMNSFSYEDILFGSTFINCGNKNIFAQDFSIEPRTPGFINFIQLIDQNIQYSMVGHLERRLRRHDSLDIILKKLKLLRQHHLTPILCIGFHKNINDNLYELEYILNQLDCTNMKLIVAYEHIESTILGKRMYELSEIENNLSKINIILDKTKRLSFNFESTLLFGGTVDEKLMNSINITIDGFLVGDRYRDIGSIHSLYESYKNYKEDHSAIILPIRANENIYHLGNLQ